MNHDLLTLNYRTRSYFDMEDLDLTYIDQNFIGYTIHQSEIKFFQTRNNFMLPHYVRVS